MVCTNYNLEPFKILKNIYNSAAADYIAAIMEGHEFAEWYGDDTFPVLDSPLVVNKSGQKWDILGTISDWNEKEEVKAGFRESVKTEDGYKRIKYPINQPGIFQVLSAQAAMYNKVAGPFIAEVQRSDRTDEESTYYLRLDFNRKYDKKTVKASLSFADKFKRPDAKELFNLPADVVNITAEKNTFITPKLYKEGVYQFGDKFYRVGLDKAVPVNRKDISEDTAAFNKQLLSYDDEMSPEEIQRFLTNSKKMFHYKIDEVLNPAAVVKASPDFVGVIRIKPKRNAPGAKFLTGYADVDKYVTVLVSSRKTLYSKLSEVKGRQDLVEDIRNKIMIIDRQLENLKKNKDVDSIVYVGNVVLKAAKQELGKLSEIDNPNYVLFQLNNIMSVAKAWNEIDQVIEFNPAEPTDEEVDLIADATEIRSEAQTIFRAAFNQLRNTLIELTDQKLDAKVDSKGKKQLRSTELLDQEGNITLMDVDRLGSFSIGQAFSSNAIENLTTEMIKSSEFKWQELDYAFNKELDDKVLNLLGKRSADTKASDFNFLFRKDAMGNSALITKYADSFYKDLYVMRYLAFDKGKFPKFKSENYNGALALGATDEDFKKTATADDYYAFEQKYYEYELTSAGRAAFDQYMATQKQALTTYDEEGEKLDQKEYDRIYKEHDPEEFIKFLDAKKQGKRYKYQKNSAVWFTKKIVPGQVPVNKEFEKLTGNQRDFYDYFTQELLKGQADIVVDYRFDETDMDRVLMEFVLNASKDLKDKVKYMGGRFSEFLKGITGVNFNEDEISKNQPRALTGLEHVGVEFKSLGSFIPDGAAITKAHPLEILKRFRASGHLFNQKKEIEDVLNSIKDITIDAGKVERTADGRIKRDIVGKVFVSKGKTNVADRVAYNVKVALTGKRIDDYRATGTPEPGKFTFSVEKTIDSVNNYTRFKAMALSPLSATNNFVMGAVNNWIYAASGQYFKDKDLARAYWIMKNSILKYGSIDKLATEDAKKIAEVMSRYNVLGDVTEKQYHNSDLLSKFFTLQESGEFLNQGATTLAQMLGTKITTKTGEKSLWDMYKLNAKNGRIEFQKDLLPEDSEWHDDKTFYQFFEKAKKINQKIHGDYTNPLMVKKDVIGRVFMLFRTWLPMAVKERFGAEYDDYILGRQKGRYISAFQVLRDGMKGIRNGDKEAMADGLKVIAKLLLPYLGRKIKFGEKMSEVDRNNIMMFVRELHFIMALSMAVLATKMVIDDDNGDEEQMNVLRYLYNQSERAQTELMFFFRPSDTMQMLRDIVPMWSTIKETQRVISRTTTLITDPEEDLYKRGFRKGKSKAATAWQELLPVTRSVQKTWSSMEQVFSDARYQ